MDNHLKGTDLQIAIEGYIEVFGHRFAEDQKIEAKNPTLEPHGIYKLMEVYVQLDEAHIARRLEKSIKTSKQIEDKIKQQLRYDQRLMYKILLSRLKHHLRLREKTDY